MTEYIEGIDVSYHQGDVNHMALSYDKLGN